MEERTTKIINFDPGPLHITFTWDEDAEIFVVSAFTSGTEVLGPSDVGSRNQVRIGDILSGVNGISLKGKSFDAIVQLLKELEPTKRSLIFTSTRNEAGQMTPKREMKTGRNETARSKARPSPKTGRSETARSTARLSPKGVAMAAMGSPKLDMEGKLVSPIQEKIHQALISDAVLAPLVVQVINESYWYYSRHGIGPKKHMHHGTKYDRLKGAWEAFIFVLRRSMETGGIEVIKKTVGHYNSQLKAFKRCEEALGIRDANPGEAEEASLTMRPEDLLNTHFRVLIVSEAFRRKPCLERISMVYASLVKGGLLHEPLSASQCKAMGIRGFSGCIGDNVLSLPIFRNTAALGSGLLIIECKTPGQWHPDRFHPEEAKIFGGGLLKHTSLADDEHASSKGASADRLKYLLFGMKKARGGKLWLSMPRSHHPTPVKAGPSDLLGVVIQHGEGTKGKKKGGVFSHFFHGINPQHKAHITAEYKKNVQQLHYAQGERDPLAKNAIARGIAAAFKDDLTFETTTEQETGDLEVLAKYYMLERNYRGIARRLQRIFRASVVQTAARKVFRRELAALLIQRIVRGYFARMYVRLYRAVTCIAALRIQCSFRCLQARQKVADVRLIKTHAQKQISRIYRGHLARRYVAWKRLFEEAAIVLETLVRGFLGRCRFKRKRAEVLTLSVFIPCSIKIQKVMRGYLARKHFQGVLFEKLHEKVVVPAARALQRVYRGYRGRKRVWEMQHRHSAAARIQALLRGYHWRVALERSRHQSLHHHMAIRIQNIARGYIERGLYKRRLEKRYRVMVVVPSVILLQANVRGHITRRRLAIRKVQWYAALKIQSQHRCYTARKGILDRWKEMRHEMNCRAATVIQTNYRGYRGRRRARQSFLEIEGRRLYAARIIIRAIRRFQYGRKFRKLMDKWQVEKSAKFLVECMEEKKNLEEDIEDIDIDIEQLKRCIDRFEARVDELKAFRKEAQLRLPQVELELEDLGIDDIEGGWSEALESEWESFNNRMAMSGEETRQLKIQIQNCEDDITKLKMERDDYEMDLALFHHREVLEYELLGRMEIERGYRKAREEFRRKVYRQKTRWTDSSTRRKVILNRLAYVPRMKMEVKAGRTLEVMSSLSSEKHWDREDEEGFRVKRMIQGERRRRAREINAKGYKSQAVSETFDSVVSSSLAIIKGATYPLRRPVQYLKKPKSVVCWDCGKVKRTCQCAKGNQEVDAKAF